MSIVKAMLTEARRLIVVMTFNDDSSASRPPFSSPRIPSKCVHQFMSHILLSAETHTLPRRGDGHGRPYLRRADDE